MLYNRLAPDAKIEPVSRKPSKRPKPSPSPTVVVADKKKAAIINLKAAILLWFNEADPISILVLASNAHDCYHALGKKSVNHSGTESLWKKMPRSFKERTSTLIILPEHGVQRFGAKAHHWVKRSGRRVDRSFSIECHAWDLRSTDGGH